MVKALKNINVVGGIIIDNNKIFCVKRGPGRSLENYWEFPGGKIEGDETLQEALKRELKEELCIEVKTSDAVFDIASYDYSFGRVNLTTILCQLKSGQPILNEHIDMKWLAPKDLTTLDFAPVDISAVKKLETLFAD